MGLFKKKVKTLYAFTDGQSIPIEDVPDDVFATKMMGDGIAIIPSSGEIYAPCDGEISMVMEHSLHALGIINEDGMELLLHIGLDTVELMGEGFCAHVKKGDYVYKGDLLVTYDATLVKEKGYKDTTMLIVVDPKNHQLVSYHTNKEMHKGTSELLTYK